MHNANHRGCIVTDSFFSEDMFQKLLPTTPVVKHTHGVDRYRETGADVDGRGETDEKLVGEDTKMKGANLLFRNG